MEDTPGQQKRKPDRAIVLVLLLMLCGVGLLLGYGLRFKLSPQWLIPLVGVLLSLVVVILMLVQMYRDRDAELNALERARQRDDRLSGIEKRLSLQPDLRVLFTNHEEKVAVAADWKSQESSRSAWRPSALHYVPRAKGNAPLRFIVHNTGDTHASNAIVFIHLPEGCKVTEAQGFSVLGPMPSFRAASATIAFDGDTEIRLRMNELTHGLHYKSDLIYVVFPGDDTEYELLWTAHASNMDQPCEGVLIVELLSADHAPTDHSS